MMISQKIMIQKIISMKIKLFNQNNKRKEEKNSKENDNKNYKNDIKINKKTKKKITKDEKAEINIEKHNKRLYKKRQKELEASNKKRKKSKYAKLSTKFKQTGKIFEINKNIEVIIKKINSINEKSSALVSESILEGKTAARRRQRGQLSIPEVILTQSNKIIITHEQFINNLYDGIKLNSKFANFNNIFDQDHGLTKIEDLSLQQALILAKLGTLINNRCLEIYD